MQARLGEDGVPLLRGGGWVARLDGLGDANGEQPSRMPRLTQGRIIDPTISRPRVDPEPRERAATVERALPLVKQGQHSTGILWVALWHPSGKEQARGRFRHDTGLATTWRGTMALTFEEGRDGEIIGLDECGVAEFFALGELGGLCTDVGMAAQRRVERLGQTRARGVAQRCRLREELLGVVPKRGPGLATLQELVFRVAHQLHEDVPWPSAWATKATHDFGEVLVQVLGLVRALRGVASASLRDACPQREGVFVPSTAWGHREPVGSLVHTARYR